MTTLCLRADRPLIRARGSSIRYIKASITAPTAKPRDGRLPVNVAFVLDRSGSMQGENKFPLAVEAVRQSLRLLNERDHFSLVVFDEHVDIITPATRATSAATKKALRDLEQIAPRGSTDLCSGWMHGCDEIAENVGAGVITRVVLLTDGQANHGEQNRDVLAHHAAELRRRGISTSTFGVGADFDERLLTNMAHEGGGNSYFVQSSRQITDLVTSELGEALEVVIPDAALTLTLPRGVEAKVLNRFNARRSHSRTAITIELGDLVSAQQLDVIIRVRFPLGEDGERMQFTAALDNMAQEDGANATEQVIEFTYASHEANDAQQRDREVDREVALLYAARARAKATESNRNGDFDRARRELVETARHIRDYAGTDAELLSLASSLHSEVKLYAEEVMAPMALKASFYVAESYIKGRSPEGKARRG